MKELSKLKLVSATFELQLDPFEVRNKVCSLAAAPECTPQDILADRAIAGANLCLGSTNWSTSFFRTFDQRRPLSFI